MKDIDEFVQNPSKITKHLIYIVGNLTEKHNLSLKNKSFIKKISNEFKIIFYIKKGFFNYYYHLINYKVPKSKTSKIEKLIILFNEFEKEYDKIIFNNIALVHILSRTKHIQNPILTMEEKKNIYLNKLLYNKITSTTFLKKFGHYAINPYEFSSKRFREYKKIELLKIARLTINLKKQKKQELKEYLKRKNINNYAVLISLKELAKYKILFLVAEIRNVLQEISIDYKINNIFNRFYDEILKLEK